MQPIFITGTGTRVGKTLVAAIVAEALHADYWKPVQAGYDEGTDSETVSNLISNTVTKVHPESFTLSLPASPHIAAREDGVSIILEDIVSGFPSTTNRIVVEGAGGIMVPLNSNEFVIDLIRALNAIVIVVSKNELGSINHSLLTAEAIRHRRFPKVGWIFNQHFMSYEDEITAWSGFDKIDSLHSLPLISKQSVAEAASRMRDKLEKFLC